MVFLINNPLGYVVVLAVILLSTKLCGLAFRKMHLPEVLGFIIAGIIIGPAVLGQFGGFTLIGFEDAARAGTYKALFALEGTTGSNETISVFSKVGVILIMFSAGLETNIDDIRHTVLASFLIATAGVAMPFALGFVISLPFGGIGLGTENIFRCVFIGTILTATSVAITVSVLKELGKINTKLGTTIVSAAVMDDVMGIVLLSVVTSIARAGTVVTDNAFDAFQVHHLRHNNNDCRILYSGCGGGLRHTQAVQVDGQKVGQDSQNFHFLHCGLLCIQLGCGGNLRRG